MADEPAAAAATPPAQGTAPPAAAAPWFGALPAEEAGFIQNKGWQNVADTVKSYRNLENMLGADRAGRTVVIPADTTDKAAVDAMWNKLGRPETPDKYTLPAIEGVELDPEMTKGFLAEAHKAGMTQEQAKAAIAWQASQFKSLSEAMKLEAKNKSQQELDEVKQEWGKNFDQRVQLSRQVANALGVNADQMSQLESVMGTKQFLGFFNKLAEKFGDPTFHSDMTRQVEGSMTKGQAKAKWEGLKRDKDWTARWQKGDMKARAEKEELDRIMAMPDEA
jgi:hypothetical protein